MRTQDDVNVSDVSFTQVNASLVNCHVFGAEGIGTGIVIPTDKHSWQWSDGDEVLWTDGTYMELEQID